MGQLFLHSLWLILNLRRQTEFQRDLCDEPERVQEELTHHRDRLVKEASAFCQDLDSLTRTYFQQALAHVKEYEKCLDRLSSLSPAKTRAMCHGVVDAMLRMDRPSQIIRCSRAEKLDR